MDPATINPLSKHFRTPAIYVKLPSGGKWWPEGSLDLPANGEIPVYPMTNADEITLKTPDALMNGSGIVAVLQSCCPNIKDAWKMPSVDVDHLLIAIRVASYGHGMSITAACPSCNESDEYEVDLTSIMDRAQLPNYTEPVLINGLKIKIQPQPYLSLTQTEIRQFEEQKIIQALSDPDLSEEMRSAAIRKSMTAVIELNDQLLTNSTEYIETEDGERVTAKNFIEDFYKNADRRVTKTLEEKLKSLVKEGTLPEPNITCSSCGHNFTAPIEFNYSRFFG